MWQDRLCKILDEKSINKLKNSTVLIIGLGGVGGSALESVVRMGIGNIVVVDNDIVDITNLNRQLLSLRSNIGISKVEVARDVLNQYFGMNETSTINESTVAVPFTDEIR